MQAEIKRQDIKTEYWFEEGCYVIEVAADAGDDHTSIARIRVPPGAETAWHCLKDVAERYIIVEGQGRVEVGDHLIEDVGPGDVVRIPANLKQRICNLTEGDLVFYAVCTPPFTPSCYVAL